MAIHKPCPRCQAPLDIPQPAPEQIRCDKCGAIIKTRAAGSAKQEPVTAKPPVPIAAPAPQTQAPAGTQPAPGASQLNLVVLAGLVGGVLLLCILPVAGLGLAWVISGKAKKTGDDPLLPEVVKVEDPNPTNPKKPKKPKELPPPDPRLKIVQPAVEKGVAYLKTKVPDLANQRAGYAGLNGLTLLECGVPPDDPAILRIAEIIRSAAPGMNAIYDLAASLFFLNRWDESRPLDEKDRAMARSFALRIIGGQLNNGIWGYGGPVLTPDQEAKLLVSLREGTYKPNGRLQTMQSMSNTQFAMLAVWGSRKHGVQIREPLLALAAYFHANQHPEGSWNYPNFSLKATSTCAGLICLAIEVALLEDKEFTSMPRQADVSKKKADVDKAFAWVAKTIGRKKSDPDPGSSLTAGCGGMLFDADAIGDLYFLWTLERVGVIYSKEKIGGKEWYDWGYPIILEAQLPDGSWHEKHRTNFGPLIDTPFALLFLKRANIARDLTEIIRTRGGKAAIP